MNTDQANPESKRPEVGDAPFITEDNGLGGVIDQIKRLVITDAAVVSCRSKVNAGGRYVLEIEVVKRCNRPEVSPSTPSKSAAS